MISGRGAGVGGAPAPRAVIVETNPKGIAMRERGMVTVELALGLVALAIIVGVAIQLVGVMLLQGRCWDTATEVARQVARGDHQAVAKARSDAPEGATIDIAAREGVAVVIVQTRAQPVGPLLPLDLRAEARVVQEPR